MFPRLGYFYASRHPSSLVSEHCRSWLGAFHVGASIAWNPILRISVGTRFFNQLNHAVFYQFNKSRNNYLDSAIRSKICPGRWNVLPLATLSLEKYFMASKSPRSKSVANQFLH
jgi:hypothetical protein